MSFDLRAYAAEHRLRVRNLHDGAPVPPARRRSDHTPVAYRGGGDRAEVIICRDGYVDYGGHGHDRVEFCVLCRSSRVLRARLRLLVEVGAVITQEGDTEAAGHAPLSQMDEVLAALHPYRRREAPAGARVPSLQAAQAVEVG